MSPDVGAGGCWPQRYSLGIQEQFDAENFDVLNPSLLRGGLRMKPPKGRFRNNLNITADGKKLRNARENTRKTVGVLVHIEPFRAFCVYRSSMTMYRLLLNRHEAFVLMEYSCSGVLDGLSRDARE